MAVTIIQHPSAISFAGNPVIILASSNLQGKTFLKIQAEITIGLYRQSVNLYNKTTKVSVPTTGNGQVCTFDLSDALQAALAMVRVERNKVMSDGTADSSGGYVSYSVKLWDEYLDEYSEVVSTELNGAVLSSEKVAIDGKYSEVQRLTMVEDIEVFLISERILSNKPDYEVVPKGGKVIVPAFSLNGAEMVVFLDNENSSSILTETALHASETSWMEMSIPSATDTGTHSLIWNGAELPTFWMYVVEDKGTATYFEFVNRLGAVESIHTFGRKQGKTLSSVERQHRNVDRSFRPSAKLVKRVLKEEESFAMSTGPITRDWAKWFVSEFFMAEKVWMYSAEVNDVIPVIIECDEDITMFDESNAEVIDLQFTVTKCINGSANNRFMI